MNRVIVGIAVFAMAASFGFTPITPSSAARSVTCHADTCDNVLPHDTDGGSNCAKGSTLLGDPPAGIDNPVAMTDMNGAHVGDLYLYGSASSGCSTAWATVYSLTDSFHSYTVQTFRFGVLSKAQDPDHDEAATFSKGYPAPIGKPTFHDAPMVGMDQEAFPAGTLQCDIVSAQVVYFDHFNVKRTVQTIPFPLPC